MLFSAGIMVVGGSVTIKLVVCAAGLSAVAVVIVLMRAIVRMVKENGSPAQLQHRRRRTVQRKRRRFRRRPASVLLGEASPNTQNFISPVPLASQPIKGQLLFS